MQLGELILAEHVLVPLQADSVRSGINVLLRQLVETGALSDIAQLEPLLADGRLRDVIAVGDHAAISHYRTDAVPNITVALGVSPDPLPAWDAGLGTRPRILFLVLTPPAAAAPYLLTVSAIIRLLHDKSLTKKILATESPEDTLALRELRDLKIQPRLAVKDIMSHRVFPVSPDTPVRDAVDLMIRRRIRAVPVVGEKREVLGLVTERDVTQALLPQIPRVGFETDIDLAESIPDISVRNIMSRSVLCVAEDMGLQDLASTLGNKDVDHVPVVSEGALSGILTRSDIIRKLFAR